MCTTCVAQGAVYVGGAVGALRILARRPSARRIAEYRAALRQESATPAEGYPQDFHTCDYMDVVPAEPG